MERCVYGFPCEEAGVGFNGFCVCVEQLIVGDYQLLGIVESDAVSEGWVSL